VHRDVSLSNIMVGHDGSVKVIDFGIAQSSAQIHRTNPGIVRGKASYMSPEQCLGDAVDLRTDVFALGVVLYELTTGKRCFQGNSDFERMLAVVRGDYVPPSVHVPEFPQALEQVIRTALAINPCDRYASAAAMIEALETVASLEGWTLGTHATQRMMAQLFGNQTNDHDELTYICSMPMSMDIAVAPHPPTKVITRPTRMARGTYSDIYEAVELEKQQASEWQDDAPTRGRRSMARVAYVAA
jgi:serine/threonine protein kinase